MSALYKAKFFLLNSIYKQACIRYCSAHLPPAFQNDFRKAYNIRPKQKIKIPALAGKKENEKSLPNCSQTLCLYNHHARVCVRVP